MTNEILKNEVVNASNETLKEKFLTTTGRIGRMTYFKRNLGLMGLEILALLVIEITLDILTWGAATPPIWASTISAAVILATFIPEYCLNVKRLHDLGKNSTLAKVFLGVGVLSVAYDWVVPAAVTVTPLAIVFSVLTLGFMLYLLFVEGNPGANEYGDAK